MKIGKEGLKKIQIGLLCLLAAGMPNLNLLMSIPTILLFVLWFFEPGLKQGLGRLTFRNPATWMVGLFLVHLIWLINTSDWEYASKDLRIKLPLLVLGLSVGSLQLKKREFKLILAFLGIGLWIASIVGYYLYFSNPVAKLDPRIIVPDISHIRLSLMAVLFIGAGFYFLPGSKATQKVIWIVSMLNFLFFLYIIQSLTAAGILVVAASISTIGYLFNRRRVSSMKWFAFGIVLMVVIGISYSFHYYQSYFVKNEEALPLLTSTALGTPYNHYDTLQVENGNIVYVNICENEMVKAWNERSKQKIGSKPPRNPDISARLIRWLTAKGLPKDSVAVYSLTSEEIKQIEMGYPAPVYAESEGLLLRYHSFLHGTHLFLVQGEAEGSSFFQRLIFWRVGWRLFKKHPFFGTGTGDVKKEIKAEYENYPVYVEPQYRLRAHNQFITFLMTFGVLGCAYFLFFLTFTLIRAGSNPLFLFFVVVSIMSFLTEDTLETQAGVTFFSFFLALFSALKE